VKTFATSDISSHVPSAQGTASAANWGLLAVFNLGTAIRITTKASTAIKIITMRLSILVLRLRKAG